MIFSSRRFLEKKNEQILLYYYETLGRLVFILFSEEIEDTKNTFRNYLTFSFDKIWLTYEKWFWIYGIISKGVGLDQAHRHRCDKI